MNRFHINSKGDARKCSAKNGNCPFGSTEEHFATAEDARKAYEGSMEIRPVSAKSSNEPINWLTEENNPDLMEALDNRFNRTFGAQNLTVKTGRTSWDGETLDWEAHIYNEAGKPIGNIRRLVLPGKYAVNEWMSLEADYRGHGFASQFTDEYESWLKELKVKEVKVYAASTEAENDENRLDGALRWAKTFDWDGKPLGVLSECWTALEEEDFTPEEEDKVTETLERFNTDDQSKWPSPKELSELGPNKLGERLLTRKVAWYGKRVLED